MKATEQFKEGYRGPLTMAEEAITCQNKPFSPAILLRCELINRLMQGFSTRGDFVPQGTFGGL